MTDHGKTVPPGVTSVGATKTLAVANCRAPFIKRRLETMRLRFRMLKMGDSILFMGEIILELLSSRWQNALSLYRSTHD